MVQVLGILHCPSFKDLSDSYVEFEQLREHHATAKGVRCFRCFAFEPLDDQPDWDYASKSNLIMIPNTADKKHLLFYLNTLLLDFAASLLNELENMV